MIVMIRFLSILVGLAVSLAAQSVRFEPLPLPVAAGATTPAFASAHDASLYVSWIEPNVGGNAHTLRIAHFDRESDTWREPRTVAAGADWFINGADTPTIAAGLRGKVAAVWYVQADHASGHGYHAVYATSEDYGVNWSVPQPLTTESHATEFVSIAPLLNGSWLAVWLDGRARADGGAMQLRSRILGNEEPDTLVDDRVCDCCNLATLVLPNGAVLRAYRDRSEDEVRDIALQRYRRGVWESAPAPAGDDWKITGCPVNDPQLARRGAHVALSWFTAAGDFPRVMTARSNDIGQSWNLSGEITATEDHPVGRTDIAVTRDGSQWISWVAADGATMLRRVAADNTMPDAARLALPAGAKPGPHARPRLTLLDNRSDQPARLLIARSEGDRVATTIAVLPLEEGAVVDDCGCGPGEDANRGHVVKGVIEKILPDRQALVVTHEEVPGVMKAMTMQFQVDPRVIPMVAEGQQVLARMERRDDGKWWLFNIRLLKTAE